MRIVCGLGWFWLWWYDFGTSEVSDGQMAGLFDEQIFWLEIPEDHAVFSQQLKNQHHLRSVDAHVLEAEGLPDLDLLKQVKDTVPEMWTKSGLMLGLGETYDELLEVFSDLRSGSVSNRVAVSAIFAGDGINLSDGFSASRA